MLSLTNLVLRLGYRRVELVDTSGQAAPLLGLLDSEFAALGSRGLDDPVKLGYESLPVPTQLLELCSRARFIDGQRPQLGKQLGTLLARSVFQFREDLLNGSHGFLPIGVVV